MTRRIELLTPAKDASAGIAAIRCGADTDISWRLVMTTKYCLREELVLCAGKHSKSSAEPLILVDEDGREFKVRFLCGRCGMEIFFGPSKTQ